MMGYTHEVAQHALTWSPDEPERALDVAELAVIDTLASALAALDDQTVTTALGALDGLSSGHATVGATGGGSDTQHAALMNGLIGEPAGVLARIRRAAGHRPPHPTAAAHAVAGITQSEAINVR